MKARSRATSHRVPLGHLAFVPFPLWLQACGPGAAGLSHLCLLRAGSSAFPDPRAPVECGGCPGEVWAGSATVGAGGREKPAERGWSGRWLESIPTRCGSWPCWRTFSPRGGSDFPSKLKIQFLQVSAQSPLAHFYFLCGAGRESGHQWVRNHWASKAYFSL